MSKIPFMNDSNDFMQDLDCTMTKVQQFIDSLEKLKALCSSDIGLSEAEVYLDANGVAELMGCNVKTAREYMNREDFPAIDCGCRKVNRLALLMYNLQRQTKE